MAACPSTASSAQHLCRAARRVTEVVVGLVALASAIVGAVVGRRQRSAGADLTEAQADEIVERIYGRIVDRLQSEVERLTAQVSSLETKVAALDEALRNRTAELLLVRADGTAPSPNSPSCAPSYKPAPPTSNKRGRNALPDMPARPHLTRKETTATHDQPHPHRGARRQARRPRTHPVADASSAR